MKGCKLTYRHAIRIWPLNNEGSFKCATTIVTHDMLFKVISVNQWKFILMTSCCQCKSNGLFEYCDTALEHPILLLRCEHSNQYATITPLLLLSNNMYIKKPLPSWLCRKNTFFAAFFINSLADSDQMAGTVSTYSILSEINVKPRPSTAFSKCCFIALIVDANRSIAGIDTMFLSSGISSVSLIFWNKTYTYYMCQNMLHVIVKKCISVKSIIKVYLFLIKLHFKVTESVTLHMSFIFNVSRIFFFCFITKGIELFVFIQ